MLKAPPSATFTEFNVRLDKGTPHFIRLHDSVVKDLEQRLKSDQRHFGILLGSIEAGANCTISVEEFDARSKVEDGIRTWAPRANSRQTVVGYYRSHSSSDFALDETD